VKHYGKPNAIASHLQLGCHHKRYYCVIGTNCEQ